MKPIFAAYNLMFSHRDFAVCVADSLAAADKFASRRVGMALDCTDDECAAEALCVGLPGGTTVLLFSYTHLTAPIICHEVTHATNIIFRHMGIELNEGSCEAFAHHNEMLFRLVAELLAKHKVELPIV